MRRSEVIGFFSKLTPAVVGMEACATSHYWARKLGALGHTVRLIPPAYVKPFVKRQKNDAADAEAICEAVSRPSMRFVPLKTAEQQGVLVLHRTRDCQSARNIGSDAILMTAVSVCSDQSRLQKIDLCASIHLAFQKLQFRDLPLGLTV